MRVVTEVLHEYFAKGVADVACHLAHETIGILEILNLNGDVNDKSYDDGPVFQATTKQVRASVAPRRTAAPAALGLRVVLNRIIEI